MDKPHIFLYILGFITNMSKTYHYSMGFLHNQTNTEKGLWHILNHISFTENTINLSVVFIIFLKKVCEVHTLFVVFYNILHKTLRYEVMKLQTGSVWDSNGWFLVVLSQYKAVPVPSHIEKWGFFNEVSPYYLVWTYWLFFLVIS